MPNVQYQGIIQGLSSLSGADGDVTLRYTFPAGTPPLVHPRAAQSEPKKNLQEKPEVNWTEILTHITDPAAKEHLQKMLSTPPPKVVASKSRQLTIGPVAAINQPGQPPAKRVTQTPPRTAADPAKARELDDIATALGFAPLTFQALPGAQDIFVLGADRKLWLEKAPFGTVPPERQQIDANVLTFQALDGQTVLALGTDGTLWLEMAPFGKVPPARQQVDTKVLAFQALDAQNIVMLGADRNLWLEQGPFGTLGTVPPARQRIDANVRAFQALDAQRILVVGTDDNLWIEQAPFGKVPPDRRQVERGRMGV